ncbi:MAG: NAD(P)H-dependent oxidoreductase [Chloroflexota bacterium]|nr:NAD(P)H-dependent oxidoreductase [Chloroflexota bacterium]
MNSTDRPFRILGIPGSLRKASFNRGLIRAAQEVAPEGVEIELYDLGEIPLYNGDVEAQGVPAAVQAFADQIRAADALLIATPEYNYSIPGVLKNAIDWASRPSVKNPLRHKPVALMGASGGMYGTARAQLAMRQVLASVIEAHTMIKPELLVNQAGQKFDSDGNLTDDDTRERLAALIEGLVAWSNRLELEYPA